ncbi:GNAT family N-acetyltransferase [Mycobacteroides abscessus]|uniref:N-acetyltransferase domain-containing protein n=2 Tax=Mycobacteroides abscessus TaxID=36809 RepID=A0AB33A7X9_9MYCO|nr:GNAT family N-acetyltransferase [Mycobacteroides abscessus]AGM27875.1 hypothetical protein MASS_1273 [Mycobacteroides abscessus subsp. bolletii 50594]AMU74473.1 hypothetical protein A3O06_07250 [Mycobacteroides abscessus]ANO23409.1 hypothetical protein BAB79_07245 [Mycobacteroides abscessus]MBE5469082.1 hypothetical protein [Mycobacteroides abscessus]MBL3733721.1 GNAT family N-acetyltransferase [Mycobacteroides abscessus subsp. massiliense]
MFDLVEAYWARVFGVGAEPGIHVVESSDEWNGVLVLGTPGCVRICVQDTMLSETHSIVDTQTPETLLTRAFWEVRLPDAEVLGPNVHNYLTETARLTKHPDVRHLGPEDAGAITELRAQCSAEDWAESGFDREPRELFGAFARDRILGAANLTMWDGRAADVGVLTYDGSRGHGWGTRLAAAASAFAVGRHGIARYRAQQTNLRSLAIARRLGYVEYGQHIALRLG